MDASSKSAKKKAAKTKNEVAETNVLTAFPPAHAREWKLIRSNPKEYLTVDVAESRIMS